MHAINQTIKNKLIYVIAHCDEVINLMLNEILHHQSVQELEALWRNTWFLVQNSCDSNKVKYRLLDLNWLELQRDLQRAIEFDQSELFRKIYDTEFGTPGGEPFSVIVANYQVCICQVPSEKDAADIATVNLLAEVAAAAFVPVLLGLHPASFGINHFAELPINYDFEQHFKHPNYDQWHKFRNSENARFIGLVLPQILLRAPYERDYAIKNGLNFTEKLAASYSANYLWGNANFAFASVLAESFKKSGWFLEFSALNEEQKPYGMVNDLPQTFFYSDKKGVAAKPSTQILFTDQQEKYLSDYGFIPLCQTKVSKQAIFYNNRSTQQAVVYEKESASLNAQIATILIYLLSVCRFAHYIKLLGRQKIGSYQTAAECESFLNQWLSHYVAGNEDLAPQHRAKYPLRGGYVRVTNKPGMPGSLHCVIYLQPRLFLEQIDSTFILVTELASVVN